jgi:predicted transcriptional regulator
MCQRFFEKSYSSRGLGRKITIYRYFKKYFKQNYFHNVNKTGELDAAIDSVRKFHLSQSKHLTSQYNVAVHSVPNEKTAHVEHAPSLKITISKSIFNPFLKLALWN